MTGADDADDDDERSIYLPPERRRVAQAEKNRLMSASLTKIAGMPVHVSDAVPADEARFVQDGRIVGRIVNTGKANAP